MDGQVAQLAGVFARTVANDRVVAAGDALGLDIRLAAAVTFKNLVKYRWVPTEVAQEAGTQPIPNGEKDQIRQLLTGLMLSTPQLVRAQLSEALAIISGHDFPGRWPTLLPELVSRLQTDDLGTINGVAATANSIFKRYRNQIGNDALVAELAASQDVFAAPALEALQKISKLVPQLAAQGQGDQLRLAVGTLRLLCRIFFSLNSPGLTPLFESQLDAWMGEFHSFLGLQEGPGLAESDPTKEAPLDGLKAAVCANINLFMEMNEEEFERFMQTFVTDVWHLLTSVSGRSGQDNLAMAATRFLTTVARSVHHKLFAEAAVLQQVCESIVLPNLMVREDDEEMFEMNPVEYIRRDAEGSDADTRRRAAADLLKALSEKYEGQVRLPRGFRPAPARRACL
ncbi:putative Exportin-2 [Monoraphidium neglectum]|uniref:Putative Exportin-2 n=1 Tax=Monoraphidium neglectum TaxID=145388 RepID=A0A0D2JM20_9CHLO|nr:putative Exportin-2 [Monoraphidium neglectum]KIZ00248.1 putative Exportin-2 [Monoraphidium neglectum]|eukprot:XP_013899267.1 putative Exportin-2 [Monoraphidium neglectum]